MPFRDLFRSDREREEEERNRDRWRSLGSEYGRDREEDRSSRDYRGESRYGSQRDWSPGGEYGSDRWRSSGGDYSRDYGQGFSRSGSGYGQDYGNEQQRRYGQGVEDLGGPWRDEERNFGGDYGDRGVGSSGRGRYYARGGVSARESGSYGERGLGRESDYSGRSGSTYGGYSGSSAEREWGGGAQQWRQGLGAHRGKGPRGYRRSDERIREDVCDCLTDDPLIDASNIEVIVKECEVTLSGSVTSREDKRRTEDLIESISGVKDVNNNLRVSPQTSGSAEGSGEKLTSPPARH
jgi:osmotically-inducible protein OsmY